MRIIAFSDIHGADDVVFDILRMEQPADVIVIAGDLTTKGTSGEATAALQALIGLGKPVVGVAGNMDPPHCEATFETLGVSVNGRGVVVGDVGFFGVSAAPLSPLHTPYELSEDEILRRAEEGWKTVTGARWKVFVPHSPPKDTKLDRIFLGRHVGSVAVREFIERESPDVVICGHIHESRGTDELGRTRMVNCGPAGKGYYAIVTIGDRIDVECRRG